MPNGEPKGEQIKKTFLGNSLIAKLVPDSIYRDRLIKSVADAKKNIKAAEDKLKTLPEGNTTRINKLVELNDLTSKVAAAETLGQTEPVKAWKKMEELAQQAAILPVAAKRWTDEVNDQFKEIDEKAKALRGKTTQTRLERREVLDDQVAQRWAQEIGKLEVQLNETLEGANTDPAAALLVLDRLEDQVENLAIDTHSAKAYKATGQRKASRQTSDAVLGALGQATNGGKDNRLGKLLAGADSEPDQYGYTLKGQIKSALEVFDDRFAQAEDSPEGVRDNTAMRVAAIASAMALRLVKQADINDPLLKPLVAKTIVKEYGAELAKAIASKKVDPSDAKAVEAETRKAEEALKVAEALLGEDPVTKVLTGKITGPEAIESIRRQAKAAGISSSRMLALQRQQLEMRVGSFSATELDKGKEDEDVTLDRNDKGELINKKKEKVDDPSEAGSTKQMFTLHDLYGELSPDSIKGLVGYQKEKIARSLGTRDTTPVWKPADKGGGLDYKPTGKQVHKVEAGDTVASLAAKYYKDNIEEGIEEIKNLNKYVFWTEQVSQDAANKKARNRLKGVVPKTERRTQAKIEKFGLKKHLPKGAVLTVAGKSGPLDQLADYVDDAVEVEDTKKPTTPELDETTASLDETTASLSETTASLSETTASLSETTASLSETTASLSETTASLSETTASLEKPKLVTPEALSKAAKRLLPPIRPEVLNGILQLKKSIEQMTDKLKKMPKPSEKKTSLEEKLEIAKKKYSNQSRKLKEYRSLASKLATQLEDEPASAAVIESTDDYARFQKLRLELSDPNYIQAPGLGQDHSLGGTLKDSGAEERPKAVEATKERNEKIQELNEQIKKSQKTLETMEGKGRKKTTKYNRVKKSIEEKKKTRDTLIQEQEKVRDTERVEGREGAINERQYAHLKMLDRWDQEEKERIQAETGKTVEENVIANVANYLKNDTAKYKEAHEKGLANNLTWSKEEMGELLDKAKDALKQAYENILSVPLTITFKTETLFSDSTKNEPAHGSVYTSDAVYTRKDVDLENLVGRGDKATGKAAITGGEKTVKDKDGEEQEAGWLAGRGKNYMRWRTDKDDREGRGDRLPFKDQQIFGAANPNWEKTHGGTDNEEADNKVGTNYYGNAHFLLKDSVRSRLAYVARGGGISLGGGKTAFQRKDVLMLFHDMSKNDANFTYLKALANIGKTDYQKTSNAWEFHLYGGFDIRKDAEAIYLADVVDQEAQERINKYAEKHGIKVVADKPKGVEAENEGPVVTDQI